MNCRPNLKHGGIQKKAASTEPTASATTQSTLIETSPSTPTTNFTGKPRIGMDESGKGDYFGPLVISAVYVDELTEDGLITLGIRDSKLLTDNRMPALAEEIKALCPHFVVPIEPKRYNELYANIQNLNRLLAWGHAWTLENMLEKVSCDLAVVDKFGDESYLRKALREKGRQITVVQQTHAEADIAVAAASILARAKFVQQMKQLSKKVGKTLPKGASDPSIVVIGRELVAEHGKDILVETVKLHFKTTDAILQN
ncbi:MAG TPA: ribonuclease HIII [Ktedonobacteraceae bacterium]